MSCKSDSRMSQSDERQYISHVPIDIDDHAAYACCHLIVNAFISDYTMWICLYMCDGVNVCECLCFRMVVVNKCLYEKNKVN